MARVTLKGSKELKKALQDRTNLTPIKQILKDDTARMQNQAMGLVRVRTGNLKRNIRLSIEDNGTTGRISAASVSYAAYQEYGTRYMRGKPYIWPSYNTIKPIFISELKKIMK